MIKDIESKANELLSSYCEEKNSSIKTPVDPIDVLEFKGFSVDYVSDKYDLNIFGALQVDKKVVEVNADVKINEGMENFTIAHELGHIVLHVPKMEKNNTTECDFDSISQDCVVEKEADIFAACLLMPESIVKDAFYQLRNSRLFLKDNFIFKLIRRGSKKKRALNFASKVIKQGNFNVSKYAMINRLIGLGLIKGIRYQKNNFNNNIGK
jgi:Zn-dependent peptidase ImmA (M78 family)